MATKLTENEFIRRSTAKHGGKYDYSQVKYANSLTKVSIVCPAHGRFEQRPSDHMRGCGCWECRNDDISARSRLDQSEFIRRANKVHNFKYDYSKVEYTTTEMPVVVICPIHGEFKVSPHNHVGGNNGCKKCGVRRRAEGRTKSTEKFIAEARKVHGDKYGYDKVVYVKGMNEVIITCPVHGDFLQKPVRHLQGAGCHVCGGSNPLTVDEFVAKAKQVHGDKYGYEHVKYVNANTPVSIVCPKHGVFWQQPISHYFSKQGCPACGGTLKLTQTEFLLRCKEAHGNRYDYSISYYTASHKKVTIICPVHGEFRQLAKSHMQGHGCDKCSGTGDVTVEEFKKRADEKYGNKYDYSKVVTLKNIRSKVEIICPKHGSFVQQAGLHLRAESNGCQICAKEITRGKRSLGTQVFIERARKKHGDKYGYDRVEYQHAHAKIMILCGIHGYFPQIAHIHLRGSGCPICRESTGERAVRVWLETNRIPHKQEKYIRGIGWFDFVVKTATGIGVIEFQGHQHYFPVDFGSKKITGLQILENNVKRDYKKRQWCLSRGYSYLPIPYWDIGQIPAILADYFAGKSPVFTDSPEEVVSHQKYRESVLGG